MAGNAERYLALVHSGRNEWWRYALGAAVILLCWLVLGYAPYVWLAATGPFDPLRDYVAVNFSIVMMLVGLALTMRLLHRRRLMTLVGPERSIAWLRIAQGAVAWSAIALVAVAIEHVLYPDRYYLSFNPDRFFVFAALALIVTPVQTTTEELVFRGYLMQGLSLLVRRPATTAVLSALIFTLPHLMNPEVQHGALLLAASYFAIGLLLAVVTLRDGRLELAIGVHAANNLVLALVANYEGSVLTSDSIFTARELDPLYSFISLAVGALVFYWIFFGRSRPAFPAAGT